MSNPTSNYGWQMPTATDLVTDLPADFEVFGQAVDTSLVDLLGGTTGQVLAKASNASMDFVWSTDASGMTNPMTTTGDMIYSSSGSTPARLGIGSAGQVLNVAAGLPAWSTPSSGSLTLLASGTLSGSSVNVSGLSGAYKGLKCIVRSWRPTQDGNNLEMRFNNSSTAQYNYSGGGLFGGAEAFSNSDMFILGYLGDNVVTANLAIMDVWDYANTATWKLAQFYAINANSTTSTSANFSQSQNAWNQTSAITALTFGADGGTFAAGDYYIYGVN